MSLLVDDDYERALEEFATAGKLAPNDTESARLVAAIRRRQGRWQESLDSYERIGVLDPQNPAIVRNLLFTNSAMRRWPEAARAAERMRAMAPASLVAKIQSGYIDFCWKGDTTCSSLCSRGSGRNRSRWRHNVLPVGRGNDRPRFWRGAGGIAKVAY